ncbi:MAG: GIY-YIG nuclease family protein [Patescibacteria group bacterium]
MEKINFSNLLTKSKLPASPGVYFFLGKNNEILYIGKAASLKNRVRSYFAKNLEDSRNPLILDMVQKIRKINHRITDSSLEALILEAALIKRHQPKYNTAEKDGKSFNCVVITKEEFPRVLIVRQKDINFSKNILNLNSEALFISSIFGPFPQGQLLKVALKIIRKIFPFRDKCTPASKKSSKPCFMRQLGLCPGVCSGEIDKKFYGETVKNIKLFLSGQKKKLLKNLEKQMSQLAKEEKFEEAQIIRNKIFALKHIQDVSLINRDFTTSSIETLGTMEKEFRIESYDIAHIMGTHVVGAMVVVEGKRLKKSDYRKFKIKINPGINDVAALKEILKRRLGHKEWLLPNLIVVDGAVAQKNAIEAVLEEEKLTIPVVAVTKDERHKQKMILGDPALIEKYEQEILLSNLEAHRFAINYHRNLRDKIE